MKLKLYALLAIGFTFSINSISATAPHVIKVAPTPQLINAAAGAEIIVVFDTPLDISSVNEKSLRIFGQWSGPAKGTISFANGNTEVHFIPNEKFFAGENVMVQLTKNIASDAGELMEAPYAWTYWIATSPGILDQPVIDTIELRLDNEGLIETYGTYAGDLNNDGFSDLVAINEEADDVRILLNDGQGFYPSFTIFDTGDEGTPSPHEGADFNNDGEIDLVMGTAWNNEVRILTGDGLGGFSNLETYVTSNGVRGVATGDFNGDGWDDIFTSNRLDGNISIFINDGDGTFTISGMDVPNEDETACIATDINNDGILDIFYAGFTSKTVGILLGDGTGAFIYSTSIHVQGEPWMLASGDFNGDGNADIASCNSNSNKTAVMFGDGLGGLGAPVHYSSADAKFPLAIDAGDLDGDGDLDLVASNYTSGNFTVYENDGAGIFSVAATLPSEDAGSCATLHDRDNDGDLDITGADEEVDKLFLFNNTGVPTPTSSIENNFSVTAFPNPANANITVTLNNGNEKLKTILICDLTGRILFEMKTELSNKVIISLKGIEDGMYLLKAETTSGADATSTFVVAR